MMQATALLLSGSWHASPCMITAVFAYVCMGQVYIAFLHSKTVDPSAPMKHAFVTQVYAFHYSSLVDSQSISSFQYDDVGYGNHSARPLGWRGHHCYDLHQCDAQRLS
jgi:hypothetical protein